MGGPWSSSSSGRTFLHDFDWKIRRVVSSSEIEACDQDVVRLVLSVGGARDEACKTKRRDVGVEIRVDQLEELIGSLEAVTKEIELVEGTTTPLR